jgi:hypothetical protein
MFYKNCVRNKLVPSLVNDYLSYLICKRE